MVRENGAVGGSSLPYVVVGTARLPGSASGEAARVLMIELTLDRPGGRIQNVATTISLPGYCELLRGLLVGLELCEVQDASRRLDDHLNGALLKPTIAALLRAVRGYEASHELAQEPVSGGQLSAS